MYNVTFTPSSELAFDTVMSNLFRLRGLVMQADADGVCIDLSQVAQCDSAGLALLIEAKRLCKRCGKSFEIRHMSEQVRDLAEFCGVQNLWSIA
jgi:phospholipid transport system transporter-binding protein